jgi:putative radical SAM enzyme (TIGR03279 family)
MEILEIDPASPLFGRIRPGHSLISINGEPVKDKLDYHYKIAEDVVQLEFVDKNGKKSKFRIDFEFSADLGLTFKEDKVLICKNKCIFCFVHQQPKGMRKALYIRDDDYRLSFTHGNFISLSNLTEDDEERIIEQRLSPLYVSVHTTDDDLRRKIFGNSQIAPIMPRLKNLSEKGIVIHTQVVVCPGINDGGNLAGTINDLYSLHPGVATLGVVPVGVTKYREKLPQIRSFDAKMSQNMIEFIHSRQKEFLARGGSRFVFAADEFYVLAGIDFPRLKEYEEMAQFENGIGMMRSLLADFNRRKRFIKAKKSRKRIGILTGISAGKIFRERLLPDIIGKGIRAEMYEVENKFWGKTVTVTGLLSGQDIATAMKKIPACDIILLPPNCLNHDRLFLDNMPLTELQSGGTADIRIGSYSFVDTLNEAIQ